MPVFAIATRNREQTVSDPAQADYLHLFQSHSDPLALQGAYEKFFSRAFDGPLGVSPDQLVNVSYLRTLRTYERNNASPVLLQLRQSFGQILLGEGMQYFSAPTDSSLPRAIAGAVESMNHNYQAATGRDDLLRVSLTPATDDWGRPQLNARGAALTSISVSRSTDFRPNAVANDLLAWMDAGEPTRGALTQDAILLEAVQKLLQFFQTLKGDQKQGALVQDFVDWLKKENPSISESDIANYKSVLLTNPTPKEAPLYQLLLPGIDSVPSLFQTLKSGDIQADAYVTSPASVLKDNPQLEAIKTALSNFAYRKKKLDDDLAAGKDEGTLTEDRVNIQKEADHVIVSARGTLNLIYMLQVAAARRSTGVAEADAAAHEQAIRMNQVTSADATPFISVLVNGMSYLETEARGQPTEAVPLPFEPVAHTQSSSSVREWLDGESHLRGYQVGIPGQKFSVEDAIPNILGEANTKGELEQEGAVHTALSNFFSKAGQEGVNLRALTGFVINRQTFENGLPNRNASEWRTKEAAWDRAAAADVNALGELGADKQFFTDLVGNERTSNIYAGLTYNAISRWVLAIEGGPEVARKLGVIFKDERAYDLGRQLLGDPTTRRALLLYAESIASNERPLREWNQPVDKASGYANRLEAERGVCKKVDERMNVKKEYALSPSELAGVSLPPQAKAWLENDRIEVRVRHMVYLAVRPGQEIPKIDSVDEVTTNDLAHYALNVERVMAASAGTKADKLQELADYRQALYPADASKGSASTALLPFRNAQGQWEEGGANSNFKHAYVKEEGGKYVQTTASDPAAREFFYPTEQNIGAAYDTYNRSRRSDKEEYVHPLTLFYEPFRRVSITAEANAKLSLNVSPDVQTVTASSPAVFTPTLTLTLAPSEKMNATDHSPFVTTDVTHSSYYQIGWVLLDPTTGKSLLGGSGDARISLDQVPRRDAQMPGWKPDTSVGVSNNQKPVEQDEDGETWQPHWGVSRTDAYQMAFGASGKLNVSGGDLKPPMPTNSRGADISKVKVADQELLSSSSTAILSSQDAHAVQATVSARLTAGAMPVQTDFTEQREATATVAKVPIDARYLRLRADGKGYEHVSDIVDANRLGSDYLIDGSSPGFMSFKLTGGAQLPNPAVWTHGKVDASRLPAANLPAVITTISYYQNELSGKGGGTTLMGEKFYLQHPSLLGPDKKLLRAPLRAGPITEAYDNRDLFDDNVINASGKKVSVRVGQAIWSPELNKWIAHPDLLEKSPLLAEENREYFKRYLLPCKTDNRGILLVPDKNNQVTDGQNVSYNPLFVNTDVSSYQGAAAGLDPTSKPYKDLQKTLKDMFRAQHLFSYRLVDENDPARALQLRLNKAGGKVFLSHNNTNLFEMTFANNGGIQQVDPVPPAFESDAYRPYRKLSIDSETRIIKSTPAPPPAPPQETTPPAQTTKRYSPKQPTVKKSTGAGKKKKNKTK